MYEEFCGADVLVI